MRWPDSYVIFKYLEKWMFLYTKALLTHPWMRLSFHEQPSGSCGDRRDGRDGGWLPHYAAAPCPWESRIRAHLAREPGGSDDRNLLPVDAYEYPHRASAERLGHISPSRESACAPSGRRPPEGREREVAEVHPDQWMRVSCLLHSPHPSIMVPLNRPRPPACYLLK